MPAPPRSRAHKLQTHNRDPSLALGALIKFDFFDCCAPQRDLAALRLAFFFLDGAAHFVLFVRDVSGDAAPDVADELAQRAGQRLVMGIGRGHEGIRKVQESGRSAEQ